MLLSYRNACSDLNLPKEKKKKRKYGKCPSIGKSCSIAIGINQLYNNQIQMLCSVFQGQSSAVWVRGHMQVCW
jgi:hypothetical protein